MLGSDVWQVENMRQDIVSELNLSAISNAVTDYGRAARRKGSNNASGTFRFPFPRPT